MDSMSSIIALAGPQKLVQVMNFDGMYDKVCKFYIPEDHGEFPDTSGYVMEEWEKWVSKVEDPQLMQHMKRCMDAVLDFLFRKETTLDKMGFQNIVTSVHWPRQGGKVFSVAGFIKWQAIDQQSLRGIKVAHG